MLATTAQPNVAAATELAATDETTRGGEWRHDEGSGEGEGGNERGEGGGKGEGDEEDGGGDAGDVVAATIRGGWDGMPAAQGWGVAADRYTCAEPLPLGTHESECHATHSKAIWPT